MLRSPLYLALSFTPTLSPAYSRPTLSQPVQKPDAVTLLLALLSLFHSWSWGASQALTQPECKTPAFNCRKKGSNEAPCQFYSLSCILLCLFIFLLLYTFFFVAPFNSIINRLRFARCFHSPYHWYDMTVLSSAGRKIEFANGMSNLKLAPLQLLHKECRVMLTSRPETIGNF